MRIPAAAATVTLPTDGTTTVDGQVFNPLTLTADILKTNFTAQTVDVTYCSGDETVSSTFTGVSLWDIHRLGAAQLQRRRQERQAEHVRRRHRFRRLSGGHRAGPRSIPISAHSRFFSPTRNNGAPLDGNTLRLVVPGDKHGGRYVSGVVNISLRDAPPPAES